MKKLLIYLVLIMMTLMTVHASVEFSEKEKAWLQKNPLIKLAVMNYWEHDHEGQNIHTQLIQLLNKYGNVDIIPLRYNSWKEGFEEAVVGESVHGIMNLSWSKQREEELFNYSRPYDAKPNLLLVRKENNTIKSLKDLKNKTVYVKEKSITKTILEDSSSKINIVELRDLNVLLESLYSKNEADAILTYRVSKKQLEKYDLKVAKYVYGKYANQHIGIAKKYPELHSIINKIMESIPIEQLTLIQQKIYNTKTKLVASKKVEFTNKELQWMKSNPVIKVGGEKDWAPFDFVDMNGIYTGLAKEYLDYISTVTNLKFEIVTGQNWSQLLSDLKNKKLDLLPAIYISKEREAYANFTMPYLALADYYITKKEHPEISDMKSLYGKPVVVIKGYDVASWMKVKHPQVRLIEVDTILDALRSVESGEATAFINDNPSTTYNIEKHFISGLKINSVVKNRVPISLHMATSSDKKILTDILNKAIKNISKEKKREVTKRWMSEVSSQSKSLDLTEKEIIWLSSKPTLKFAVDPNWLPIESINKETKQYEGMMADVLNKIVDVTGLKFELIPTEKWNDSVNLAKQDSVDMLAAVSITPERKKFLNFTDKTIILSDGVIMKNDSSFITSLDGLKGLRIGVSEGTSLHNMLKKEYPTLILVPVKGIKKGLDLLEGDSIDAFVGNLEVASHIIFQKSLFNLKVVFKLERTRHLHIGLSKNIPFEARTVINKALSTISDKEMQTIRQRWIGLKINEEIDYTIFYKIALAVLLLVLFFVYWNRKLNHMVAKKTAELNILLDSFDKNVIFSRTDLKGKITHASEAFCKISGYEAPELIGKPHNVVRHPDMPKETFEGMWKKLKNRETVNVEIKNIRKDGSFYWTDGTFEPLYDKEGKHIGYNALRTDITDKKAVEELSANLEKKVVERTLDLEQAKEKIEEIHKLTKDSIEYASLIQHALIPNSDSFDIYFKEHFALWKPKDIVGGDIYLFEELRGDHECLLMVIDCTGHGVPGAFVTMLVKAIERQIVSKIVNNPDMEVSPAWILWYFNKSMKRLLRQDDKDSVSNAGFDGGILYYNKNEGVIKYAGAETPLFYFEEDELKVIKGDRHSIGYKKSNLDYEFKEHAIEVKKGMQFYLTTDGYLDQNGGDKGFPFGKKRFQSVVNDIYKLPMNEQEVSLLKSIQKYKNGFEQNDDVTVIGLKF